MRLSEWRAKAPFKESTAPAVLAVVEEALVSLGAETDPECWVAWGDDPSIRYLLFAATPGGLIQLNVRVNVPGEGPRAAGKVLRWGRVQLGELAVEIIGGHRLVTFQVENQVLNGADAYADAIGDFAQAMFAAVDGRPIPSPTRKITARPAKAAAAKAGSAKGAPAKPGARAVATKGSTR